MPWLLQILGLFHLTLGPCLGSPPAPEAWFHHDTTTYISHYSWTLVFSLDLDDYGDYFMKIGGEIQQFSDAIEQQYLTFNTQDNSSFTKEFKRAILPVLRRETDSLSKELSALERTYRDMQVNLLPSSGKQGHTLRKRNKRALLGFMQPVLKFLFGLSGTKDIKNLRDNVNDLRRKYDRFGNAWARSMTILNSTRTGVNHNHDLIHQLNDSLITTQKALNGILLKLQAQYDEELEFNRFVTNILVLFDLASSSLHRLSDDLFNLKADLTLASQGSLSATLISPEHLRDLLKTIRGRLPQKYTLPYPTRDLQKYYTDFPVLMAAVGNSLTLAMVLPLKELGRSFELYSIYQVPVLHNDYLYVWQPESQYFALSQDEAYFAYLDEHQYHLCKFGVCSVTLPMYRSLDSASCTLALFKRCLVLGLLRHSIWLTITGYC